MDSAEGFFAIYTRTRARDKEGYTPKLGGDARRRGATSLPKGFSNSKLSTGSICQEKTIKKLMFPPDRLKSQHVPLFL